MAGWPAWPRACMHKALERYAHCTVPNSDARPLKIRLKNDKKHVQTERRASG